MLINVFFINENKCIGKNAKSFALSSIYVKSILLVRKYSVRVCFLRFVRFPYLSLNIGPHIPVIVQWSAPPPGAAMAYRM